MTTAREGESSEPDLREVGIIESAENVSEQNRSGFRIDAPDTMSTSGDATSFLRLHRWVLLVDPDRSCPASGTYYKSGNEPSCQRVYAPSAEPYAFLWKLVRSGHEHLKPQASSLKPQASSLKPQASSLKPQAYSVPRALSRNLLNFSLHARPADFAVVDARPGHRAA